jgi:hypothetical protein
MGLTMARVTRSISKVIGMLGSGVVRCLPEAARLRPRGALTIFVRYTRARGIVKRIVNETEYPVTESLRNRPPL